MENNLTENQLIANAVNDRDALLKVLGKYAPLVKGCVGCFSGKGIEYDDLMQDGMIGLVTAVNSFDSNLSSFSTFAKMCVMSALAGAFRANNKKSTVPKELFVEIDENTFWDDSSDPEFLFGIRDEYSGILKSLKKILSHFEYTVFCDKISGYQNEEIAIRHSVEKKSVENALNRIHNKVRH